MKLCGHCRKNNWRNAWILVPVLVGTRGKTIKSFAHKTCIPKWRKVSDVQVDLDSGNPLERDAAKSAKEWLEKTLPQQARERDRRREERNRANNQRRCACGREIYWKQSTRCPSCHTTYQHQTFRNPK